MKPYPRSNALVNRFGELPWLHAMFNHLEAHNQGKCAVDGGEIVISAPTCAFTPNSLASSTPLSEGSTPTTSKPCCDSILHVAPFPQPRSNALFFGQTLMR